MFDSHEKHLQELIQRAETPVLGLLGALLPIDAREAIKKDLAVMPSAKSYCQRLDQYPALFGVWLAEHVMLGFGQNGHFSLYPHIQKAIGVHAELNLPEKDMLWRAFRRAMLKLGIQPLSRVNGAHFMADEYVRQAGVPIAFADDLAQRMLQVAKKIGLPDEDDQEGLLVWQSTLLNKLVPPFSVTARKAVERDSLGYYTRAFARVYMNGGQAISKDPLEQALAKAFTVGGSLHLRRASIPQLYYRDGALGVLFPIADRIVSYRIECDGHVIPMQVNAEGGFRTLAVNLYREIIVQRDDGERVLFAQLWPDSKSNRLLIFNTEGRLQTSAQLAQPDPVELPPEKYIALCRFEPSNVDYWEEISESPVLVEVPFEIRPGEEFVIQNGPATVTVIGQNQPTLYLSGSSKSSLEGVEVWYQEVEANIEIPIDWIQNSFTQFEVRVLCGNLRVSIPVKLDEGSCENLELSAVIALLKLGCGVWRLVVELGRVGETRAAYRKSIFYWVGLKSISYGLKFNYEEKPKNLVTASCAGVKVSDTHIEPSDDDNRLVRIAVDISRGRRIYLSWHRPGVFVEVHKPNADGTTAVNPRTLGAAETVSLTSAKTIVVSSSEPGFISLGSMRTFVDFSRKASKNFPASFLASRLEPGARTLKYETASGNATIDLLVLSQPHVVAEVKTERIANLFEIKILVLGEPTAISITGHDLVSGREARAEHELTLGVWHTNELGQMQVYAYPLDNIYSIQILINVETLKPGIWIIGFGARIGGAWGRLQDGDEGRIALAIGVNSFGKEIPISEIISSVHKLELANAAKQLLRLNEHFRNCWSSVCWQQQQWLMPYFSTLVNKVRTHESEYLTDIVDMAMSQPAEDGRPGYLSMQFAPAALNHVFSQPRASYKRVNIKAHPLSIGLRAMAEIKGGITQIFGTTIHPTAATSFKNIADIMHGRRPKGFSLKIYSDALEQTQLEKNYELEDGQFIPKEGELLGPLHLAHAWKDLERRFDNSQLMPNNRKNTALALAKKLKLYRSYFDDSFPKGLRNQAIILRLGKVDEELLDTIEQTRLEHIAHIATVCAWLAWYCRIECRNSDELSIFYKLLDNLRQKIEIPGGTVTDCIAYYLQVAPAMFAFYLLLWELVQTVEFDPIIQNV